MEVIMYIIAFAVIIGGFISLIKDGREKGLGFVICEIIGVVLLAAFGL